MCRRSLELWTTWMPLLQTHSSRRRWLKLSSNRAPKYEVGAASTIVVNIYFSESSWPTAPAFPARAGLRFVLDIGTWRTPWCGGDLDSSWRIISHVGQRISREMVLLVGKKFSSLEGPLKNTTILWLILIDEVDDSSDAQGRCHEFSLIAVYDYRSCLCLSCVLHWLQRLLYIPL